MKFILTITLSILVYNCIAQSPIEWIDIKKPKIITAKTAKRIKKFKNTPESILTYFYASRIRNDEKWLKVTPISRSRKLEYAIKKYQDWKFIQFKILSKANIGENKVWVKLFFEIEHKGGVDSGIDEACLEFVNGKWVISTLPT